MPCRSIADILRGMGEVLASDISRDVRERIENGLSDDRTLLQRRIDGAKAHLASCGDRFTANSCGTGGGRGIVGDLNELVYLRPDRVHVPAVRSQLTFGAKPTRGWREKTPEQRERNRQKMKLLMRERRARQKAETVDAP
jgi:hypothetical protein